MTKIKVADLTKGQKNSLSDLLERFNAEIVSLSKEIKKVYFVIDSDGEFMTGAISVKGLIELF